MTPEAPASLLPSLRDVAFVCPVCRGELNALANAYRCSRCDREFPLMAGIPDFRVFADPYLPFEEDRRRTQQLLEKIDDLAFPELLADYWSLSDETPAALRGRFIERAAGGRARAQRLLDRWEPGEGGGSARQLEVGSGTGNLLAEAGDRFPRLIGTDIAMRWLHVSRRRLRDEGRPEPALVCCCAEALPFADASFDGVFSIATLEFARDPDRFLSECARVLAPGGSLLLNTVNRYSLALEPHVALWGVGWLPRRWQAPYVSWRRRASFENIRLLSYRQLRRSLARDFEGPSSFLPRFGREVRARLSPRQSLAVSLFRSVERLPGGAAFLTRFGPEWDVAIKKPARPAVSPGSGNRGEERALRLHRRDWEDLARLDPLWAIFTRPQGRFRRWDLEEFFQTGREDVARLMETAARLGLPAEREAALDFGCGVGRLTRPLADHFASVDGVDISETMVEEARRLNDSFPTCRFRINTREDLRFFPDDRFDLVLSNWVLQHLPRRSSVEAYIREFVRVVKPSGLVMFQLRSRLALAARLAPRRRLFGLLSRVGLSKGFLYRRLRLDPMRLIAVPEEDVRRVLESAGAEVIQVERYAVRSGQGVRFFATKRGGGAPGSTTRAAAQTIDET